MRFFLAAQEDYIRLEAGRDSKLPIGVNFSGYFCCSSDLNKICTGEASALDDLIFKYPNMLNAKVAKALDVCFGTCLMAWSWTLAISTN